MAGQINGFGHLQPGGLTKLGDLGPGKAQAAMIMLMAQRLDLMGGEINHHQSSAGAQYPRRLGDHGGGIVGIMQHLMNCHQIEGRPGKGQVIHVALAH